MIYRAERCKGYKRANGMRAKCSVSLEGCVGTLDHAPSAGRVSEQTIDARSTERPKALMRIKFTGTRWERTERAKWQISERVSRTGMNATVRTTAGSIVPKSGSGRAAKPGC